MYSNTIFRFKIAAIYTFKTYIYPVQYFFILNAFMSEPVNSTVRCKSLKNKLHLFVKKIVVDRDFRTLSLVGGA